ncbi:MAG: aldo/keto reductase, partial [Erysipelotrichaceae bacterium]|nr:aldo/keto reductase [Erysipelotrichaceae bacterium]
GFQKLLLILKEIGDKHNVGISQVATRYILQQEAVAAAVIGVRNSRHVADNENIFSFELDEGDMNRLKDHIDRYPNLPGEPFELERTIGSRYRNIMHMNINEEEQN